MNISWSQTDEVICDEMWAIIDSKEWGIYAVYFGWASHMKNIDAIPEKIDFLAVLTASGTQIIEWRQEYIDQYIITNRDNIVWNTMNYSNGTWLLTQRRDAQTSINKDLLLFSDTKINVWSGIYTLL